MTTTRIAIALVLLAACSDDAPGFVAPEGYPGTFDATWTCSGDEGVACPRPPYGRARTMTIRDDAVIEWLNGPTDQGMPEAEGGLYVTSVNAEGATRSEYTVRLDAGGLTGGTGIAWFLDSGHFCGCSVALARITE